MKLPIPVIGTLSTDELAHYISLLNERLPDERFVSEHCLSDKEKAQCDIAVVANPTPTQLVSFTSLVWIHSVWAGVEKLVANLSNKNLKIVRLVDPQLSVVMSEAVLAWTLYLHRDMPRYAKQQAQKVWSNFNYSLPENKTVGILGMGELGKASARRLAKNGFNLIGWSRHPKNIDGIACLYGESGFNELLTRVDILISLLPLTPDTHHLLNHSTLQKLPRRSAIINFSRGAIIDTTALLSSLDTGHISHAVLDVFDPEPLPQSSPLWSHDNVTVLPHVSAPTLPQSACDIVANNISDYRHNGKIPPSVDLRRGY